MENIQIIDIDLDKFEEAPDVFFYRKSKKINYNNNAYNLIHFAKFRHVKSIDNTITHLEQQCFKLVVSTIIHHLDYADLSNPTAIQILDKLGDNIKKSIILNKNSIMFNNLE